MRRLITPALILLAGLLLNVAVALLLFHFSRPNTRYTSNFQPPSPRHTSWWQQVRCTQHAQLDLTVELQDRLFGLDLLILIADPAISLRDGASWSITMPSPGSVEIQRVSAGLPFRSLGATRYTTPSPTALQLTQGAKYSQIVVLGALNTSWTPATLQNLPEPLTPIWLGFTANTLLYAALIWLLMRAASFISRILRRRPGLCSVCCYPIGTSPVCTECGAAIPPPAGA